MLRNFLQLTCAKVSQTKTNNERDKETKESQKTMHGAENTHKQTGIPILFQLKVSAKNLKTKTKHECDKEARVTTRGVSKPKRKHVFKPAWDRSNSLCEDLKHKLVQVQKVL